MLMRSWTPPSQVPTGSLETNAGGQRTCLRWCKLFISALIPLAIVGFCVVYTLQKEDFFDEEYQRQQNDEYKQQQRLAFDAYIQDISNALLQTTEKDLIAEKYLHIQSKTLLILRNIDLERKKEIILFLYERNLLRNDRLNLQGADLNNVELTCPHDFDYLHLQGVHWSNGVLINCHLAFANFDQAHLVNIRFVNCTLYNASFIGTKLERSHFIQTNIRFVDFSGASLVEADFLQAEIVQGNNFMNADLYRASLTKDQLEGKKLSTIEHNFSHARYPNGSFDALKSDENLVINGNAEMECNTNPQTIWKSIDSSMILSTENITDNDTHSTDCSFVASSKLRVYQTINLHSYSLLIDTQNAVLKFIGLANCNQSYFEVHIYHPDGILLTFKKYSEPMEETNKTNNDLDNTMHQYGGDQYPLPIHTRRIDVYFGINKVEQNTTCYFDNIALTIHHKLN